MTRPANLMRSTFAFWTLIAEANTVISLRVLGIAGILPAHHTENKRMAAEKAPAFAEAMVAGARAAMQGQSPERVALATMRPLRRRTRANVKRLSKPRAH